MKLRNLQIAAVISAMLVTAACSSRRPNQLPPAPPSGTETGTEAGTTGTG